MKALSLQQPWANMIASGKKTIETRKWKTKYRGPLLIVSSKKPAIEPAGQALAMVTLVDIVPMDQSHVQKACIEVYPKAYAWILEDIKKLAWPFPVDGRLGIYEVPVKPINFVFAEVDNE